MSFSLSQDSLLLQWECRGRMTRGSGLATETGKALDKVGGASLNTIAAFLANSKYESGNGAKLTETTIWKWGKVVALTTEKSRARIFAKYPQLNIANPASIWAAFTPKEQANAFLGFTGAGNSPNNDDGWNYRGRGLIHITGKSNYTAFNSWLKKTYPDRQFDVITNPDSVASDPFLAANSGVWFAFVNAKGFLKAAEAGNFSNTVKIVSNSLDTVDNRRVNYDKILKLLNEGGNPYDNIRSVLGKVGIKTLNSGPYQHAFQIPILRPTTVPIAIASSNSHQDVSSEGEGQK
ncbi:MAG: hypothetical protein IPG23_17045 [Burkholderiales bacterium]|nr:hypothetical protein [Burkholderiales bacterium]